MCRRISERPKTLIRELLQQRVIARAVWLESHRPLVFTAMLEMDVEPLIHFARRHLLEPLDQADAVRIQIFAEVELLQLVRAGDAVEVDMINRQAAVVFVDQRERRASYPSLFADFDAFGDAAHETGLAAAEIARQTDNVAAVYQTA